jgi:hypothetical protein
MDRKGELTDLLTAALFEISFIAKLSIYPSPLGEGAALLEESAANKSTNEEATIRGTDQSKGQSHSQKGGSDVGTTTLSRETKQNTGDERSPDAESLAIIQAQIRGLQSDKAKLVKELNYTKSQLRDSQQATAETLDNSQRHMDSIVGKTAKELLNLQKKLEKAEAERAEYQRNFKDAQEKIFSMQPRRSDITEDEAIEEYSSLCVNVENWIETNLGDVLDLDYQIFAQSKVDVLGGSQLIGLIEMTRGGALALDIPDTLLYCLRNAIMNFICHRIFQGDLYAGDPGPWPFISFIETNMRNLEPRRGKFSCQPSICL